MGLRSRQAGKAEAGFSMIEMLMAAVILAIGVLGVTLMQAMALKASRGSRSVTSATQVAERILDQVELEGRLTWLNLTSSDQETPGTVPNLQYINLGGGAQINQYYDNYGNYLGTDATNAHDFYHVNLTRQDVPAVGAGLGGVTDFTVVVTFTDTVGALNVKATRNVTLVRRIVHG